ncbi:MAG: hypothetical protein AB9869_02870 [Verrucomicrobiia bacterium]
MRLITSFQCFCLTVVLTVPAGFAHEVGEAQSEKAAAAVPLEFVTEREGPVSAPPREQLPQGTPVTGQGFWRFVADRAKVPIPPEALPKVKGAHGTLIVDASTDTVYWGLQDIGWIAFTHRLSKSAVVAQDHMFKSGNLHGADLLSRRDQTPLVAVADNVEGEVYLSDISFQHPAILRTPPLETYTDGKGYAPTDVAFESAERVWITDGYGRAWFMPAQVKNFHSEGQAYGGKTFSATPHGITFDPRTHSLIISARPEGLLKSWDPQDRQLRAIDGLPKGSTVCDVDLWGDYALAPCLDGANNSPGPIYIVNLKKKAVVATLKPKVDLGYEDAQHIHDACWYTIGQGPDREVYILFTNWNPGGIGALRLVNLVEP